MSEVMKKPRTEASASLNLLGPAKNKAKVLKLVKDLGYKEAQEKSSVPWRELLGDFDNPGSMLKGARTSQGLTQKQLSDLTGIPQHQISEMENNKRSIGKNRAKKLAAALHMASYRILL